MMPRRPRLNERVCILGAGHAIEAPPRPKFGTLAAPRATKGREAGQNTRSAPSRVVGLDLAIQTTGWCLLVDGRPDAHGSFVLPDRKRAEPLAGWLARRAEELARQVRLLVVSHRPDVVGFEYPDTYRRAWSGGTKGREFAVSLALGRAQGFLVALWPEIGGEARLVAISTSDAKRSATGRVDANKQQVRWALATYRGWDLTGWTDDESDAAAVALAAFEGVE